MTVDLLVVPLSAPGFPAKVRLGVPDAFVKLDFGFRREAWALIGVPSERLMEELAKPQHAYGYPNASKLRSLEGAFLDGVPIEVPMLEFPDGCTVPNFSFFDGRHRINVLTSLGAKVIPVAVPWHRADELITYFS